MVHGSVAYFPVEPLTLNPLPVALPPWPPFRVVDLLPIHKRDWDPLNYERRITTPVNGVVIPHLVQVGNIHSKSESRGVHNISFGEGDGDASVLESD